MYWKSKETVVQTIASAIDAHVNCLNANPENVEWRDKWESLVNHLTSEYMPSGSGFDNGTKLDIDSCIARAASGKWTFLGKLVFTTAFHHHNESGYDGWTDHVVTVRPTFRDYSIQVSGRNRNDIKEHITEEFGYVLDRMHNTFYCDADGDWLDEYHYLVARHPEHTVTQEYRNHLARHYVVSDAMLGALYAFQSHFDAQDYACSLMRALEAPCK